MLGVFKQNERLVHDIHILLSLLSLSLSLCDGVHNNNSNDDSSSSTCVHHPQVIVSHPTCLMNM